MDKNGVGNEGQGLIMDHLVRHRGLESVLGVADASVLGSCHSPFLVANKCDSHGDYSNLHAITEDVCGDANSHRCYSRIGSVFRCSFECRRNGSQESERKDGIGLDTDGIQLDTSWGQLE